MYRQYDLQSGDQRTSCWLSVDHRLKVGVVLRLADHPEPDRRWTITGVGHVHLPQRPYQRWRVGGL